MLFAIPSSIQLLLVLFLYQAKLHLITLSIRGLAQSSSATSLTKTFSEFGVVR
jgi:hypothetical protein